MAMRIVTLMLCELECFRELFCFNPFHQQLLVFICAGQFVCHILLSFHEINLMGTPFQTDR